MNSEYKIIDQEMMIKLEKQLDPNHPADEWIKAIILAEDMAARRYQGE